MASNPFSPGTPARVTGTAKRLQSIDLLRGAVMILMAIDHVRVYSGIPAGGQTYGVFFTRWVTHFCVPAFVFFAGTSAFLYGNKATNKGKLAGFLLTRGLLLVLLELTLIRFCWTGNLDYANFTLAGVIWMLGWCLVLLAAFVRLKARTIGIIGLAIIFLQQLLKYVPLVLPPAWRSHFGWFWELIYPSGGDWPPHITILYVLVPWIGVMMAGYGFGLIVTSGPIKRIKTCLRIGLAAIAVFLVAGTLLVLYGPPPKYPAPFIFRLLGQQKYPASQLYLLMTLGPLIALIPFAERVRGWFANVLVMFGRVPLFYYLLHIPLIHLSALLVNFISEGKSLQELYVTAPFDEVPEEHRWSLPLLYLVFIIVEVVLFFACRWYANYKSNHPEKKWLKYL